MHKYVLYACSLANLKAGATLGWMNSGTAKRSTWCPLGDESVEGVRDANLFMSRTVFVLLASNAFAFDACFRHAVQSAEICMACCLHMHACRTVVLCVLTVWRQSFFAVESVATSALPLHHRFQWLFSVMPACTSNLQTSQFCCCCCCCWGCCCCCL